MNQSPIKGTIELSIQLIILFLLIGWCLLLIFPFVIPVMWAVILAVSLSPVYNFMSTKLGDRSKLAAFLLVLFLLILILVPSYFFVDSMIVNLSVIGKELKSGELYIPQPNAEIAKLPLIGGKLYDLWEAIANNIEQVVATYSSQIKAVGKWILNLVMGLTTGILQMVLSLVIAGVLLATSGTKEITHKLFKKLAGDKGEEFADLSEKTIRNVTKGILGVAIIQSILVGVLFYIAGVPYAGICSLLVLMLGIMQLPPAIVTFPVIFYLYSTMTPTMATVWTVLIMLASLSDNILKPILLGQGSSVPMLVIFLGAIGGFIVSGFLGLFTGAIVLSLGYKLLISWLDDKEEELEIVSKDQ